MPKRRRVSLKFRLSAGDVHYAGGLASGAKILEVFGDLATELSIIESGKEGLFRAYKKVEFLAPVKLGDFIEAKAEVVKEGKTSRTASFEAYKYIESDGQGNGKVLKKKILVAKAEGTYIV